MHIKCTHLKTDAILFFIIIIIIIIIIILILFYVKMEMTADLVLATTIIVRLSGIPVESVVLAVCCLDIVLSTVL